MAVNNVKLKTLLSPITQKVDFPFGGSNQNPNFQVGTESNPHWTVTKSSS